MVCAVLDCFAGFFLSTTRKFQHALIQYCIKCTYKVHIYLVTLLCTVILKSYYMSCFHPASANIIQLTMCTLTHVFMLWKPVQEDIIANISVAICCIQPLKQTISVNEEREMYWLIKKTMSIKVGGMYLFLKVTLACSLLCKCFMAQLCCQQFLTANQFLNMFAQSLVVCICVYVKFSLITSTG